MKLYSSLLVLIFSLSTYAQVGVSPLFTYGNLSAFDEVTNLRTGIAIEIEDTGTQGYDLLSVGKAYLSAGAQGTTNIGSGFYTGLGLYPSFNGYAKWTAKVKNREDFSRTLPLSKERLFEMNTGDAIYWNALGGVTVNIAVGYGPVAAGPKVSIEGGYAVYVERKDKDQFYVEVRRLKTHTFGVLAGTYIAYAELSRLVEKTTGLAFLIDAGTRKGEELILDLVRNGRADRVQESDVTRARIGDLSALKILSGAHAAVGTPFIPVIELRRGSGSEVVTETRNDIWGNTSDLTRAVSFKDRSVRLFKKKSYFQSAALVEEGTRSGTQVLRAQLHWYRKGNRMTTNTLRKALVKLRNQTAMKFPEFSVPQNEKLGFAKVSAAVDLSATLTQKLRNKFSLTSTKETAKHLQSYWQGPVSFGKLKDLLKKCGGTLTLEVSGERIARVIQRESFEEVNCEL